MAFSKNARAELRVMESRAFRLQMLERGWCSVCLRSDVLERLGIEHEVEESTVRLAAREVYAPVWVFAVHKTVVNASEFQRREPSWQLLELILAQTAEDVDEQLLVCGEAALDPNQPRDVRRAATTYMDLLTQRQEHKEERDAEARP